MKQLTLLGRFVQQALDGPPNRDSRDTPSLGAS